MLPSTSASSKDPWTYYFVVLFERLADLKGIVVENAQPVVTLAAENVVVVLSQLRPRIIRTIQSDREVMRVASHKAPKPFRHNVSFNQVSTGTPVPVTHGILRTLWSRHVFEIASPYCVRDIILRITIHKRKALTHRSTMQRIPAVFVQPRDLDGRNQEGCAARI